MYIHTWICTFGAPVLLVVLVYLGVTMSMLTYAVLFIVIWMQSNFGK